MKDRLLPTLVGLSIALIFAFNSSITLSHVMYWGAACLLYREIIDMNTSVTKSGRNRLLITGALVILFYATLHALLLFSGNGEGVPPLILAGLNFSGYELGSALIFLYTSLGFLLSYYLLGIFAGAGNTQQPLSSEEQEASFALFSRLFQELLVGLHALFYSTFFLYSIVKIKYSYLYLSESSLTPSRSLQLLLLIWILVWIYDSMAYVGGRLWGKRKLGLQVSPQKSWAGLFIGMLSLSIFLVGANLGGIPMVTELKDLWFFQTLWQSLILAVLMVLAAQLGDLIASFFKRSMRVKDSGKLFGTHGGFLDRNDSAVFTFAIFYYILLLMS